MFSQGILASIYDTSEQTANELIIPGDLSLVPELSPTPAEESSIRGKLRIDWPDWVQPKGVSLEDRTLPLYRSSYSLRKWGKEKILRQLHIIPSAHTPNGTPGEVPFEEIPQLPQSFVEDTYSVTELPSFEEKEVRQAAPPPEMPVVVRGNWGLLQSTLLEAPTHTVAVPGMLQKPSSYITPTITPEPTPQPAPEPTMIQAAAPATSSPGKLPLLAGIAAALLLLSPA